MLRNQGFPISLPPVWAAMAVLGVAPSHAGPPASTATRINWAKYQEVVADSSAGNGSEPQLVTDGLAGEDNAWRSSSSGEHWIKVVLPEPRTIGSVQLYLGDTDPADGDSDPNGDFSLNFDDGVSGMRQMPGGAYYGNTTTIINHVLGAAITVKEFMFYTSDAAAAVQEIALLPPRAGGNDRPIGTDVTMSLGHGRRVEASSVDGGNFAKHAVDGYAGADVAWRTWHADGPHRLDIDLGVTQLVGAAHVCTGSSDGPAAANFRLQYWTGADWWDTPGGVISGNTQKELAVPFNWPVSTSRIRLLLQDNGQQTVRELALYAATSGVVLPAGAGLRFADPPTTRYDHLSDHWYTLQNRHSGRLLSASGQGATAGAAEAFAPERDREFQVLYNYASDTFRIRHRATGQCLESQHAGTADGTPVVIGEYHAQPHQLWQIEDAGNGFGRYVNVWSGLVLETDSGTPATMTLSTPDGDWRQHWLLAFDSTPLRKGLADFGDRWDWQDLGAAWNYNWGWGPAGPVPPELVHLPMQWGRFGVDFVPAAQKPRWQSEGKPHVLLGFNEPDTAQAYGGSDMTVQEVVDSWPYLEAAELPLLGPAPAVYTMSWMNDFEAAAAANGLRIDYSGVHWYGPPDAGGLLAYLQGIHSSTGRPVWLTEFGTTDWGGTGWTEEDNYRFMIEFLWLAEDRPWLKRYFIWPGYTDPPAAPWTRTYPGPNSHPFDSAGRLTAVGELYAGWDGDRGIGPGRNYLLHGKGSSYRMGSNGAGSYTLETIREAGPGLQWLLVPAEGNPAAFHFVSAADGMRLRCNAEAGTVDLVSPASTGSDLEWTITAADGNGCSFIDCPSRNRRLRLNRTNDGNGAPTGLWVSLDDGMAATDDWVRWRFIKPSAPEPPTHLPAGWTAQDIGEPAIKGYAYQDEALGAWKIGGGGADIWGRGDQFHYASLPSEGDIEVIARVDSVTWTAPDAKAGIMIRSTPDAAASFAFVFVTPVGDTWFQYRDGAGSSAAVVGLLPGGAPGWLKLTRIGSNFEGWWSANGVDWTSLGIRTIHGIPAQASAGLAVTAHDNGQLCTATFASVATTTSPASGFDGWRYLHFNSWQLADNHLSGQHADPNGDQVPNLLAYAAGLDPWTPATTGNGGRPRASQSNGRLAIHFNRNAAAVDLRLSVEGSDNPEGAWNELARSVGGGPVTPLTAGVTVVESGNASTPTVEVRDSVLIGEPGHPTRFLRLRAVIPDTP